MIEKVLILAGGAILYATGIEIMIDAFEKEPEAEKTAVHGETNEEDEV